MSVRPLLRPSALSGRAALRALSRAATPAAFAWVLVLASGLLPPAAGAQQRRLFFRFEGPDGQTRAIEVFNHRGYQALPVSALADFGWTSSGADEARIRHSTGPEIRIREGSPFFRWEGDLFHFASEPYSFGGELHLPLQLLTDFFPDRLPEVYALAADGRTLSVSDEAFWVRAEPRRAIPPERPAPSPDDPSRVVVIDPGHGGRDPGATGPSGVREKDVALAVGLALRRALEAYPDLEVHMTRDTDELVPIWERGEWATEVKGERPGVFISLHADALQDRGARGFSTYFLSDARTEHERRVTANENAPLAMDGSDLPPGFGDDLSFILKELRNLDHQHWSALLADIVQREVGPIHPGPDRGVKQGPLAVITNALMPAVLVETGFISNPREEAVLAGASFQEELAEALARSVVTFFQRYPSGQAADPGGVGREVP